MPVKIKAISLWQPWASLWAAGIKIHETRDWPTTHQGLLAVHAAKHQDADAALLWRDLNWHREYSQRIGIDAKLPVAFRALPFGAIVGVVHVVRCYRTEHVMPLPDLEILLGNFQPGRYAWRAENARLFKDPIPWKGRQGFFNVEIPEP